MNTNVLDSLSTPDRIDAVITNPGRSDTENELADRLQAAMEEIDRMTVALAGVPKVVA